jgi:SWIM zinc finger
MARSTTLDNISVACACPDYQQGGYICKHVRAVVLFEQRQAQLAPMPKHRYEDLFPACKNACGDLSDTLDGYCSNCASDREWEARRDHFAR